MTHEDVKKLSQGIDRLNEMIQQLWRPALYPRSALDEAISELGVKGFEHLLPIQYSHVIMPPRNSDEAAAETQVYDIKEVRPSLADPGAGMRDDCAELLLFIGLNPSTTSRGQYAAKSITAGAQLTDADFDGMRANMRTDLAGHPYFQPIREFRTNLYKYHVDLFALFHTSQTNIDRIIGWACMKGNTAILDFFRGQVEAIHDFVFTVQPAQTAVINAFSRDAFLGARSRSNIRTNHSMINQYARYTPSRNWATQPSRLEHPNYKGYMHSAAMLSGQRAMDKGSRERLEAVSMAVYQRGCI